MAYAIVLYDATSMNLIYGTHKMTKDSITMALKAGCVSLDTATGYKNDDLVAEALAATGARPTIITKFNSTDFEGDDYEERIRQHCARLNLDKTEGDYLLLHTPLKSDELNLWALRKLREMYPKHKFGVSNFSIAQIQYLLDNKFPVDMVSLEFSPFYQPVKLVKFCHDNGIVVTGYRPTYKGAIFGDAVISSLAAKYGATNSKVVLSWMNSKGIGSIMSTSKAENLTDNLSYDSIVLAEDDLAVLNKLNTNVATCMTKYCKHDE
jgi:diketogulonate reductase-like aldo/keto reductase